MASNQKPFLCKFEVSYISVCSYFSTFNSKNYAFKRTKLEIKIGLKTNFKLGSNWAQNWAQMQKMDSQQR